MNCPEIKTSPNEFEANSRKEYAEMGKSRIAGASPRDEKETRRTSATRFADDYLERR